VEVSLDKVRDEIISYLRNENLNIFYGSDATVEGCPFIEIQWQHEGKWKEFIEIAKKEGVQTIILEEHILSSEDIKRENASTEILSNDVDANELQKQLKSFSKYVGKVGELTLMWVKGGVKFCYVSRTKWFDDFVALTELIPRDLGTSRIVSRGLFRTTMSGVPKELKEKSAEDLAEELAEFLRKEFPECGTRGRVLYIGKELFWEKKGVRSFEADPETRILMERVESLVDKRLTEQQLQDEKEKLPDLIEACIDWAKEYGLKKLTKTNLRAFLAEKGEPLSRTSEDILLQQVNFRIKV